LPAVLALLAPSTIVATPSTPIRSTVAATITSMIVTPR
jgi:hypothetical protein